MTPEQIERFWSRVDKSGECWLWTAYRDRDGYGQATATIAGKRRMGYVHRLSYSLSVGTIPDGMQVDHMCHNRGCVNPEHLRIATRKQNQENRFGADSDGRSQIRGVSWDKAREKWAVYVTHNNHQINAGRFDTIDEAEAAAIAKRNELFTHNLNDRNAA